MQSNYCRPFLYSLLLALLVVAGCGGKTPYPTVDIAEPESGIMAGEQGELLTEVSEVNQKVLHFDFDSSALKPVSKDILREVRLFLEKHPEYKLTITGHTDTRGTKEYNLALSERRASAAKKFLLDDKSHKSLLGKLTSSFSGNSLDQRIEVVAKGKDFPIDLGTKPEAHAKNRRDELYLDLIPGMHHDHDSHSSVTSTTTSVNTEAMAHDQDFILENDE